MGQDSILSGGIGSRAILDFAGARATDWKAGLLCRRGVYDEVNDFGFSGLGAEYAAATLPRPFWLGFLDLVRASLHTQSRP